MGRAGPWGQIDIMHEGKLQGLARFLTAVRYGVVLGLQNLTFSQQC